MSDDDSEKKDITSIFDLGEFDHENEDIDADTAAFLKQQSDNKASDSPADEFNSESEEEPALPDDSVTEEFGAEDTTADTENAFGESEEFGVETPETDEQVNSEDDSSTEEFGSFGADEGDFNSDSESESAETTDFNSEGGNFNSDNESESTETTDFTSEGGDFNSDSESDEELSPIESDESEDLFESSTTEEIDEPEAINETQSEISPPVAAQVKAPIAPPADEMPKQKATSDFKDVHNFMQNMSFGNLAAEGNPPYSLVLKDIKYKEDVEGIIEILKKHSLIKNEDEARTSLSRGTYLISRVSEFAAIYLAHRLRVFDLNILVGLAEQIHPPKNFKESAETGVVSKRNAYQNYSHEFELTEDALQLDNILITTLSHLDGFEIKQHLGTITEHRVLDQFLIENSEHDDEQFDPEELLKADSESDPRAMTRIYQDMSEKLKVQAMEKKANAIIGVSYQMTPLVSKEVSEHQKYKITMTGNMAIAIKEQDV